MPPQDLSQSVESSSGTDWLMKTYIFMGAKRPQDKKYHRLFYAHSAFIHVICIVVSPIVFSFNIILNYKTMRIGTVLNSTQALINVIGIPLKIIAVVLQMGRFEKSNDVLKRLDCYCRSKEETERLRDIANTGNRVYQALSVLYYIYGFLNFAVAIIIGQMPYTLYNPFFDWHNSQSEYVAHAVYEFIFMFYLLTYQLSNDGYVIVYLCIVKKHMDLLIWRVERLGQDEKKSADQNLTDLVNCVKCHKDILELLDTISPLISITMFVQFFCTTAALSICLINILVSVDSTRYGTFVYFMAVMFQVAPACYMATTLVATANELPDAIFHCHWTEQSQKFRKMLIFFIQRAQKQISLTAMQIFTIDLNTFINLAKFSFSMYTLMKEMEFTQ